MFIANFQKELSMKNINLIEFKEVICELLHVDKEEVNINTKLSDLNLDSLDYMQLFYDIEEKFNIEISEGVFNQINPETDIEKLFNLTNKNIVLA